eukprot:4989697-Amphidinium_carterae.1
MRDYLERALQILERHYGPDHPHLAGPLSSLGNAYECLGNFAKMRDYFERALQIQECHYGPDHPEVAKTLTSLGDAYEALRDAMEILAMLEDA